MQQASSANAGASVPRWDRARPHGAAGPAGAQRGALGSRTCRFVRTNNLFVMSSS